MMFSQIKGATPMIRAAMKRSVERVSQGDMASGCGSPMIFRIKMARNYMTCTVEPAGVSFFSPPVAALFS